MTRLLIRVAPIVLMAVGSGSVLHAQNSPAVRQNYFQSAPAGGEKGWAGVRTSLQFRVDGAGGVCRLREVDENTAFKPGDRFRMRIQPNVSGYVYVLLKASGGDIKLLFPSEEDSKSAYQVRKFETRTVPATGWFKFDNETGLERIYLFISPKPVKDLERLASRPGRTLRDRDLDKLLEKAEDHPSQTFDEGQDGAAAGASYYVERLDWETEYLVRRFRLKNKQGGD
jgi:hypothetical protein